MLPVMMNIATLTSCHGAEQFMRYLKAMKVIEKKVKAGSNISCTALNERNYEAWQENGGGGTSRSITKEPSHSSRYTAVHINKFTKLQFRQKLEVRGRPKCDTRQLCSFNRTSADIGQPQL